MTQTTQHTLVDLIAWLADNKYMLGRRFSEWTNRAPTLEAAVAAAAMAQDELGHARSLYAALRNVPDAPEAYLNEEKRERLLHMPLLNQSFEHWADFVAASALLDRALTLVFEAARESTHEPLRQRAAKILQEEWFHRQYGVGWLKKMAGDEATHDAMQAAVNRVWSPTLEWIGGGYNGSIVAGGILNASAEALSSRWVSEAKSLLAECGLMIYER
ncbi:MAG TPA: Phenylacetic acid catabolic protein [Anaerolineales bacterium]|nr:Phenylacetic acid catabolic protein [Anaerolineales bacterium]